MTITAYEEWTREVGMLPSGDRPTLVAAPHAIEALRAIKDAEDIGAHARGVARRRSMRACAPVARAGTTERELAWEVQRYAMEHGAEDLSFPTIIAGGPWGALPHAIPRDVPLAEGAGVWHRIWRAGRRLLLRPTRTICLGEPDAQFRRIYDIVLTAQETAEERIEAGMTGAQAHEIAATVIRTAGHGEHFGHGFR